LYGDPLPEGALGRLGTVRFRNDGTITSVAFAPSGKVLASTGAGHGVSIWDAATGRPLHRLPVPFVSNALAITPDGKTLVTDSLFVIDLATGKVSRRLAQGPPVSIGWVAISPDGQKLASAIVREKTIVLWDLALGTKLRTITGTNDTIFAHVAFTLDGRLLAAVDSDNTVRFWEVESGDQVQQFTLGKKGWHPFAVSPNGKLMAAGHDNGVVRLWNYETRKVVREITLEQPDQISIWQLAFSPNGKSLAITAVDSSARARHSIWSLESGNLLCQWRSPMGTPLAFSPDGKVLAGIVRQSICLWDAATGQEIGSVAGHLLAVQELRFSHDGKILWSSDLRVQLEWDIQTGRQTRQLSNIHELPDSEGWARSATVWSPDRRLAAIVGRFLDLKLDVSKEDPSVHIWDSAAGKELYKLEGHNEIPRKLGFSPDGKVLATSGKDGIRLWDTSNGRELQHLTQDLVANASFAFSPNSNLLALAAVDKNIMLRDIATGKEQRRWQSQHEGIGQLAFSLDGTLVGSVGSVIPQNPRNELRVWLVATGKLVSHFSAEGTGTLATFEKPVFSPNGRLVAVAERDRRARLNGDLEDSCVIHVVEVLTGQSIRHIESKQGWIESLAFSPNGRTLASGGRDSTILLWDLTGQPQLGNRKPAPLSVDQLDDLWSDLAGEASKADKAIWALVFSPQQSLPFLKKRLQPVAPADALVIAKYVGLLDDTNFAVRQKAAKALDDLGEAAEPALRKTLDGKITLEVRQRIEQILEKRNRDALRNLRTIEALEQIGTADAREVLQGLTKGAANPRIAQGAEAALRRLGGEKQN
jgi:WD40 repeat protein